MTENFAQAGGILVLQLDSAKLEADGLDLVPFSQSVARFAPGTRMTIVCATRFDDLLRRLAELHGQTFEVVAVMGHSNERGLVLAAGRPVDSWNAVAQYLSRSSRGGWCWSPAC